MALSASDIAEAKAVNLAGLDKILEAGTHSRAFNAFWHGRACAFDALIRLLRPLDLPDHAHHGFIEGLPSIGVFPKFFASTAEPVSIEYIRESVSALRAEYDEVFETMLSGYVEALDGLPREYVLAGVA